MIGVLAMSVDCGEFNVLENNLPKGHEVVLLDLREANIDGVTRRGLILHHQREDAYRKGAPIPWVSNEVLAQIDESLKKVDSNKTEGGAMLPELSR